MFYLPLSLFNFISVLHLHLPIFSMYFSIHKYIDLLRPYVDPTSPPLLFSLHQHHHCHNISIVFPPPTPPPPPHFYCLSLHHHHHHISIVFPYTTTITTFLLFFLHHHHHRRLISFVYPYTTTATTFLLFFLHHHHRLISFVSLLLLLLFPSSSFLLFSLEKGQRGQNQAITFGFRLLGVILASLIFSRENNRNAEEEKQ